MASASIANAAAVHTLVARLEDQVLKEYSNVSHNLDEMSTVLQRLSSMQPYILNQFRPLERKLGLVLTLFKGTYPPLGSSVTSKRVEQRGTARQNPHLVLTDGMSHVACVYRCRVGVVGQTRRRRWRRSG
ncbi:BQ5605_C012g07036 [Microbotryum silenes-dioicae]|uniref:DASH complex subunit DAD3 n=1 Tax=Microbotryum silenes-dioicae TaxID=796604 RepID=A0A2X0NQA1_9BASI|nr:BQ5605_C012g07036 [Microbotryum silenes-dioicae]